MSDVEVRVDPIDPANGPRQKPGGKAARKMIRNAVNREIQEARKATQKVQRQRADVFAQMVQKVAQLEARVAFLERQGRPKGPATP